MKKVCLSLLSILILLCNSNIYGQSKNSNDIHRFGIYGGLGISTITGLNSVNRYGLPGDVDYPIQNFSFKPKMMFDVGFTYQYEKINKYFLQTNIIVFNDIGVKIKGVTKNNNYGADEIDAINTGGLLFHFVLGKKLNINNKMTLIAGAGPCIYINYSSGYGGSSERVYYDKEYYDEYNDEYYYVEDSYTIGGKNANVKPFGLGANAILGIETGNCQIAFIYDYSFTKMFKDTRFNSHHKSIKLSFSYFFDTSFLPF